MVLISEASGGGGGSAVPSKRVRCLWSGFELINLKLRTYLLALISPPPESLIGQLETQQKNGDMKYPRVNIHLNPFIHTS